MKKTIVETANIKITNIAAFFLVSNYKENFRLCNLFSCIVIITVHVNGL